MSSELIIILVCLGIATAIYLIRMRMARAFYRRFNQRDAKGREVALTPLARATVANLPLDFQWLAQKGETAAPRKSLDSTIMRTTLGTKLIAVLAGGVLLVMLWGAFGITAAVEAHWIKYAMSVAGLYAIVNTLIYEVRYDDHAMYVPDFFFQKREYLWRDLVSIHDDGHYLYKLRFANGRKASVMKYMTGIREFVAIAQDRIPRNVGR